MVTVVFPAAGQGKRMKAGMNKVFLELSGKPILIRTLLAFSACGLIDQLIVVVGEGEVNAVKAVLKLVPGLKPYQVVAGSDERQYSIYNGLTHLSKDTEIVLVHDAARPLVPIQVIEDVIVEARRSGAAIAAIPEKNTIKIVDENHVVSATPERSSLWSVQTPQGFQKDILVQAYQKAQMEEFLGTDDASLVERLGIPVKVVPGDYCNVKITTPEDLFVAEAFLRADAEKQMRKIPDVVSSVMKDVKEILLKRGR